MDIWRRELLLEKFEVISRAADGCIYALEGIENLTKEELKYKLNTRLYRIAEEVDELGELMESYFDKVSADIANKEIHNSKQTPWDKHKTEAKIYTREGRDENLAITFDNKVLE